MKNFDIIIAGGGPAGLSSAVELSKYFKILILEKEKPGTTGSTWYSYEDRAKKYQLEDAVVVRTNYIKFTAPTTEHFMKDDCVIFDHNKVLEIWIERAKANGAEIKNETFICYKNTGNKVSVKTNKGTYQARLLVDSMGITSPIITVNNLIKRKDAWIIYGAKMTNVDFEVPYQLEYFPLNDEDNTYFGIHPHSDTETNIYAFKGQKDTIGNPEELKDKFEKTVRKIQPKAKKIQTLKGTIVSGTLRKYALDNVIFFGSSGMLNPDGCGMGFNQILMKHREFAIAIRDVMETDSLDQRSLEKVAYSLKDYETINFQKIIGVFSLYFIRSKGKWDGGVKWLNAMGEDSKYWMRNEMTIDWIRSANLRLNKVIPLKEAFRMIPFSDFFFILGQLIRFKLKSFGSDLKKAAHMFQYIELMSNF